MGRVGANPAFRALFARHPAEEVAVTQSGARDRPAGEQVRPGDVAEQAAKPVRVVARVGLVAYGLVNLVLASLIAQVALGRRERADKKVPSLRHSTSYMPAAQS